MTVNVVRALGFGFDCYMLLFDVYHFCFILVVKIDVMVLFQIYLKCL